MAFRPSPRQLEYFVALADTGHFGKAAEKCHVSQPTLSAQFKLLEDQLGVPLFDRGRGRIAMTPAAETLLPMARQVLEQLDDFVDAANARRDRLGGLIRLGVSSTFGPYFLPHLLPVLKSAYPDLELYIREDRPNDLERAVLNGLVDCVISPDIPADDRLDIHRLCSEKILLGVPAGHELCSHGAVSLERLRGETLLTLGQGYRLHDDVQALVRATGAGFRTDYEGSSLDALRHMVSIGMGLALFPAAYIASEFDKQHGITLRSISGYRMERQISFAWRRASARTHHFSTLLDIALTVARDMDVEGVSVPQPKPGHGT